MFDNDWFSDGVKVAIWISRSGSKYLIIFSENTVNAAALDDTLCFALTADSVVFMMASTTLLMTGCPGAAASVHDANRSCFCAALFPSMQFAVPLASQLSAVKPRIIGTFE